MADAMYTLYVAASRILSVINQLRGARAIEQHRPILFTRVGRFWEDNPVRYFLRDSPELLSPLEDDELRHVFVTIVAASVILHQVRLHTAGNAPS